MKFITISRSVAAFMKTAIGVVAGLGLLIACGLHAAEPQYPSRPIRIIVPFPPGAATDTIARLVGAKLTETWGQQVVVDNRGGAGGNIGMGIAANAPGDGYTILFVSSSFMVNAGLYSKIPYDPYKSFIPISNLSASPHVFFSHSSQPVKSLSVPAGTPGAVVKKLYAETARIMQLPDVKQRILEMGADVIVSTPQQFTAQIKSEVAKWSKVIQTAGIRVE